MKNHLKKKKEFFKKILKELKNLINLKIDTNLIFSQKIFNQKL